MKRQDSRFRLVLASTLVLAAAAYWPSTASADDRATGLARMVGVWQLDSRVSEDPHRVLRTGIGRSRELNRRDRRGEGRGQGESVRESLERRLEEFTVGAQVLEISFADPNLTIGYWDDRERVLGVNGKKVEEQREYGPVVVEAGWKSSDRVVVVTKGAPGGKIVEIFELGERGRNLFVTVQLQRKGSKYPFSFRRVYNRLAADG